eukprot:m.121300 g.121300  ORF g.121300 m.121300 type:complete len:148 (-) comp16532_c1_seq3:130-573(-)
MPPCATHGRVRVLASSRAHAIKTCFTKPTRPLSSICLFFRVEHLFDNVAVDGCVLELHMNGTWRVTFGDSASLVDQGTGAWKAGQWVHITLTVSSNGSEVVVSATVDGTPLLSKKSISSHHSLAGGAFIGSGIHHAMFDGFSVARTT